MPSRSIVLPPLRCFWRSPFLFATLAEDAAKTKCGADRRRSVQGRRRQRLDHHRPVRQGPGHADGRGEIAGGDRRPVADPKASAGGKPVFYDVDAIVDEADGYAANRSAGKPASRTYAGFCHYEYLCDSLSCSYVWVC